MCGMTNTTGHCDPLCCCGATLSQHSQSENHSFVKADTWESMDAERTILRGQLATALRREKALREALEGLLAASGLDCEHVDTHRGGTIWTICDYCGAKWEGDTAPPPCDRAQAAINALAAEQEPDHA